MFTTDDDASKPAAAVQVHNFNNQSINQWVPTIVNHPSQKSFRSFVRSFVTRWRDARIDRQSAPTETETGADATRRRRRGRANRVKEIIHHPF